MNLFQSTKRIPGAGYITKAATVGYKIVAKPIITSSAGQAVTTYASDRITEVVEKIAGERGFEDKAKSYQLTEENLKKLDAECESLVFTNIHLLVYPIHFHTIYYPPAPNSDALEFTDDDLLDFNSSNLDSESYRHWSTKCAPPSKQFSDWEFEDDGRGKGQPQKEGNDDNEGGQRNARDGGQEKVEEEFKGLSLRDHAEIFWDVAKGFAKRPMP